MWLSAGFPLALLPLPRRRSVYDPCLLGAVCGSGWVGWDLRYQGTLNNKGEAHSEGATAFRWSPSSIEFATTSTANEAVAHLVAIAPGRPWSISQRQRVSHSLPTRAGYISWMLSPTRGRRLVAACDSKVCLWDLDYARA